jgi:predicted RNase H-like HicB family nuclease
MSETSAYITVTFRAYRDDETGQFVSTCEELGVSSCGDDLDGAFDNLSEAVELYLEAIEDVGERERILRDRNIFVTPGIPPNEERLVGVRPEEYVTPHTVQLPVAV